MAGHIDQSTQQYQTAIDLACDRKQELFTPASRFNNDTINTATIVLGLINNSVGVVLPPPKTT